MDEQTVLHSWKEIARHLNCAVRTAQRWERELDLPVRRPRGKFRSSVLAIPEELDRWVKTRPTADIRLELTAPTLRSAMLQAAEKLEARIDSKSRHLEVRLILRLGEGDGVKTTGSRDELARPVANGLPPSASRQKHDAGDSAQT